MNTFTMDSKQFICIFLLICALAAITVNGYKILGVFPIACKSHFIIGDTLMRTLAEKGHNVTMISPYSMKDKIYRGIEVSSTVPAMKEQIKDFLHFRNITLVEAHLHISKLGIIATHATLHETSVQKLMKSKEKFDVIIMEIFATEALFGFADLFQAPMIAFGLFGAISWNTDLVGTPSPPSYVPNSFTALTDRMSLLERIGNLAISTFERLCQNHVNLPIQEEFFKTHFPKAKRSLEELRKDTALVLLNQHVSLSFSRPYLPNMIEVGGLHINRRRKPLPADVQKFLDAAKNGAIYFSMGSVLKSGDFPAEKLDLIVKTFKSLKQRVLWKFEDAKLPGKSENVYISEWFPQDAVLAHPNVKLFITHGGMLSTTESIYHGKPFIGIPIFGDQFLNMARAEVNGFAIMLDYNTLSEDHLRSTIIEMLENPKYTELVREMSARYRDQPIEPMDLATYWIEYVARHKGAPHLHSAAQQLNFIQYHNIDAIAILCGGILFFVYILVWLIFRIAVYVTSRLRTKFKLKTN